MPDTKAPTAPATPKVPATPADLATRAERAVSNFGKALGDGPAKTKVRKMALELKRAVIDLEDAALGSEA